LQPEGIVLDPNDFEEPLGPGNPLKTSLIRSCWYARTAWLPITRRGLRWSRGARTLDMSLWGTIGNSNSPILTRSSRKSSARPSR
jgi:hypothetical protein